MFHFHKYKTVIKERTEVKVTNRLTGSSRSVIGLKALEVCTKCNKVRAFLSDGSGTYQEIDSCIPFTNEQIENALDENK